MLIFFVSAGRWIPDENLHERNPMAKYSSVATVSDLLDIPKDI